MTLAILALTVVAGGAVLGAYRLLDRVVSIQERESEARLVSSSARVTVKIPDDVTAKAATYGDEWARDAFLARAQELYEKTGDWGQARFLLEEDTR